MNDIAIDKLFWFLGLPECQLCHLAGRAELEEKSYVRWCISELITAIMDHPTTDALDTLEELWMEMLWCHHCAPSPRSRRQFRTALDTLDTIRALL
ncbi:hypothetical protein CE91St42_14030 [Oscillospiraceae bacterium]|nr:hypothetical protein CE91St42_14030 [Oscillospiraceae bacterium]